MKRGITVLLCLLIALCLCGCSSQKNVQPETTQGIAMPETTYEPDIGTEPTIEPDSVKPQGADISAYQYSTLSGESGSFSMEYPSHWTRKPGTNTICFVEPVVDGDFPARIAFTKKTLNSEVTSEKKSNQLASYLKNVLAEFDSYTVSELDTSTQTFMGETGAYSATYSAVKGDKNIKGFVVMSSKEKTVYVYHFRAEESDYAAMATVMTRIKDSIHL